MAAAAVAFPLAKIGGILISACAQPLTNYLKRRAANNLFFRERICIPMGRFYNTNFQRRVQKVTGTSVIPEISAEQAVQLGVEIYGEFLVFLGGGTAAFIQYLRQRKKRLEKEAAQLLALSKATCCVECMEENLSHHETRQNDKIEALSNEVKELRRLLESG